MNTFNKNILYFWFCAFAIYFGAVIPITSNLPKVSSNSNVRTSAISKKTSSSHHQKVVTSSLHMRTPINWQKSSETVAYPNLSKVAHLWVKVSISKNRTYLYNGKKVIYTMYSSAGRYKKDPKTGKKVSTTPTGTFHVQPEKGASFYNASLNEGANYYTSWLNHGEYLFHSVPTVANGSYNTTEAKKLGKSTGSHGCVRLSVSDAHWMMQNLPVGTKVKIVN